MKNGTMEQCNSNNIKMEQYKDVKNVKMLL